MHRRHPSRLFVLLFTLLVASVLSHPLAMAQVAPTISGADLSLMDRSVAPGDDFYRYANGRWLDTAELPEGKSRYGTFGINTEQIDEILLDALLAFEADLTTDTGRARAFYDQILDVDTRNDLGIEPIQPILDEIMSISSIEEGLEFQAEAWNYRLQGLFYPAAMPGAEDSSVYVGYIFDSDLSLPSFWDYLDESPEGDELREEWVSATAALLQELGYSRREARLAAQTVLDLETAMALQMWYIPGGDVHQRNIHFSLDELQDLSPAIDWEAYVEISALPDDLTELYTFDPIYLESLEDILDDADPLALQYLFASQLAWSSANYLTIDMFEIAQIFDYEVVRGIDAEPNLEEFAFLATTDLFPDVFGQVYVDAAFTPEMKAEVEDLVDHILEAFRIRLQQNTWMSDETRERAIEKLDLITPQVGYPEVWATYEEVEIGESALETRLSIHDRNVANDAGAVGATVINDLWDTPAQEVNATYYQSANSIVIPAGILRAPFYDPNASFAANYGGIGMVIGHEITHAFDNDGADFDGHGNLVFWWEQEDYDAFSELSAMVSDQYEEIELDSGLSINGDLTLGENIADMGGVQAAYLGLVLALEDAGTPITRDQQRDFFIAYAQLWRSISTFEYESWLVKNDPHSPGEIRAVQPLRNMEEFHEAFNITRGDNEFLPRADRIVIW